MLDDASVRKDESNVSREREESVLQECVSLLAAVCEDGRVRLVEGVGW